MKAELWHNGSMSAIAQPKQKEALFSPLLSPAHDGTTGEKCGKRIQLMEAAKKKKRDSDGNRGQTRVNNEQSISGEQRCCVKACSPINMCTPTGTCDGSLLAKSACISVQHSGLL